MTIIYKGDNYMASPTITWHTFTGAGETKTDITELDYGSVQAGSWSEAKCLRALFTGNSAQDLKFWLYDTSASVGNPSVALGAGWIHKYDISTRYKNPEDIDDNMKAGTNPYLTSPDEYFGPITEGVTPPASSNFITNPTAGNYCDRIYLACQPPVTATDGETSGWGFRLSFLYP